MIHRLPNGITVVLEENRAAPVVALQAWVQVGSADESDREAGLAHLHEHMLFKGTSRRGPGEIARDIEARGGEVNAWTSFDQTVYHLTIASAFYQDGLEILSDQVLGSIFDAEELEREIEVVLEEIKRGNDMPARQASREMFDLLFTRHPYRRPVIGYPETVRSFTRDDVLAFYRRHYTPDNITLVAVGDFESEAILRRIEELWGGAEGKHGGRHERPVEPEPTELRVRVKQAAVQESRLALAWPIPDIHSEDMVALDLAGAVLGHGGSARLVQEIKEQQGLCNEIYAYAYTPKDPGLFVVGSTMRHEQVAPSLQATLGLLRRFCEEGCSEEELEVAKHLVESESIWQRETVQGMARKLGFYQTVTGDLDFERRYYERVRATSVEQVVEVCRRYLRTERMGVVVLGGMEARVGEEELKRLVLEVSGDGAGAASRGGVGVPSGAASSRAPAGVEIERTTADGSAAVAAWGSEGSGATASRSTASARNGSGAAREDLDAGIVRAVLPSGARVLVRREPKVPVVAVRAAFLGGLRHESEKDNGIHHLLARVLTKGTRQRSARDFAARCDALGAYISAQAGRNSFSLRGDFLAKNFEASMRLFAEALREPAFEAREVERERNLQLEEIRAREDNPAGLAFQLFAQSLYRNHPYRMDVLGEPEVLRSLGPDHLRDHAERSFGNQGMVLGIVGDVDVDEAFALAEEFFGEEAGQVVTPPELPEPQPPAEPTRAVREMEKEQAHLVLGFLGLDFHDPQRRALEVLSSVLAGQGGRLFTELRDKRSMAYSVTAFSLEGIDPGYFGVYMGTSPEKLEAAEEGILAELEKVVQQPIGEDELLRAQRQLIGGHAIGLQRNASRAAVIALDESYGLGASRFTRYREEIEAVTREDVLAVARRILDLDRRLLAVVTPAKSRA